LLERRKEKKKGEEKTEIADCSKIRHHQKKTVGPTIAAHKKTLRIYRPNPVFSYRSPKKGPFQLRGKDAGLVIWSQGRGGKGLTDEAQPLNPYKRSP